MCCDCRSVWTDAIIPRIMRPALSVYYNQREVETGNYPYMDAFVMGKWKRMRIFLKYQHVNKGLFGNGEYFSAARYPLNPGMFKIGIS